MAVYRANVTFSNFRFFGNIKLPHLHEDKILQIRFHSRYLYCLLLYLLIMHYTCYLDITRCFFTKLFTTTCRAKLTENVSRARDHVLCALPLNDHEFSG